MNKNQNRKNKNKLFDIEKSSSTFISLMAKYRKQKRKIKNENNNRCYIVKVIDDKKHELEREEKDDIYIYKEAKNAAHINQELLLNYGIKAKTKSYDTSKIQTHLKLGRKKFFDPTQNNLRSNLSTKILKKGYINLPVISQKMFLYRQKPILTYSNSNYSKLTKNKNYNTEINHKVNIDYLDDSNIKSIISSPLKKYSESNFETETNLCPSSFRNCKSNKNLLITETIKNKIIKRNTEKKKKYIHLSKKDIFFYNGNYLKTLADFKEQLIREEKQNRNYFSRNDYGCNLFKEKFTFLKKKYFEE